MSNDIIFNIQMAEQAAKELFYLCTIPVQSRASPYNY